MPRIEMSQTAFNGGELHPALWCRTDLEKYATGAALLQNMIPRPYGGAYKRPGTHCIGYALENDKPSRLIPFKFSTVQNYILEFGHFKMRIIKDDGLVVYPAGHPQAGQIVVVSTPYAAGDLYRLRCAQRADVMRLTLVGYQPQILKRLDHHIWTFQSAAADNRPPAPNPITITRDGHNKAKYCVTTHTSETQQSIASNVVESQTGRLVMPDVNAMTYVACREFLVSRGSDLSYDINIWSHDTTLDWPHSAHRVTRFLMGYKTYVTYGGFDVVRPTGESVFVSGNASDLHAFYWSEALNVAIPNNWGNIIGLARNEVVNFVNAYNANTASDGINHLSWPAVPKATHYSIFREIRTEDSVDYYYIGSSDTTTFIDNNLAYNPNIGPPSDDNYPFSKPSQYPGVCVYFEQRMVYARSEEQVSTFWGSVLGDYDNFGKHQPIQEDDRYSYTLDSNEVNEILWMIPLDVMLIGTSGGEWKAGGDGYVITPKNVNCRIQSWYGCSPIQPIIVGRSAVFVERSHKVLRDLSYSLDNGGFDGDDLTLYAQHLFEDSDIYELCYQQSPDSLIWVVMSDGKLRTCTYLPKQRVVSWARHETQGSFKATASLVDEKGKDKVYFVVEREINGQRVNFLEVLYNPIVPNNDLAEAFYVDCGLSYSGSPVKKLSGLEHLEGMEVDILADGNYRRDRVAGGKITLQYAASRIHVGLPYTAAMETLNIQPLQAPVKGRPHSILGAEVSVDKTVSCRVGPVGGPARELIRSKGDGAPVLASGQFIASIPAPSGSSAYRLRFESVGAYPMAILAVNAIGDFGEN